MADYNGNRTTGNTTVFKALFKSLFGKKKKQTYKPYTNEEIARIQNVSRLPATMQKQYYAKNKPLAKRVAELTPKAFEARPVATGIMEGFAPTSALKSLQSAVPDVDVSKTQDSLAYKAGYLIGNVGQYATTGGLAQAGIAKGLLKGSEGVGKRLAAGAGADVLSGVPLNVAESLKTSKDAKEFAKNFAMNTALDVGVGSALSAAPYIVKALKKSKATKVVADTLEEGGYIKDAEDATKVLGANPEVTDTFSDTGSLIRRENNPPAEPYKAKNPRDPSVDTLDLHEQYDYYQKNAAQGNIHVPQSIEQYGKAIEHVKKKYTEFGRPDITDAEKALLMESNVLPVARALTGHGKLADVDAITTNPKLLEAFRQSVGFDDWFKINNAMDKRQAVQEIITKNNLERYDSAYTAFKRAGEFDFGMDYAEARYGNVLDENTKNQAYNEGVGADLNRPLKAHTYPQTNLPKDKWGYYDEVNPKKVNFSKQERAINAVAQEFGLRVVKVPIGKYGGFQGAYGGGYIYLTKEQSMPIEHVFAHEFWHHLRNAAPEESNALEQFLRKELFMGKPEVYEKQLRRITDSYSGIPNYNMSEQSMFEEIMANQVAELLYNPKLLNKLLNQHPNVIQRIAEYIDRFVTALKTIYTGNDTSEVFSMLGIDDKALDMFSATLKKARENLEGDFPELKNIPTTKKPTTAKPVTTPKPVAPKPTPAPITPPAPTTPKGKAITTATNKILKKKGLKKSSTALDKDHYYFLDFNNKLRTGDLTGFKKVKGEKNLHYKNLHPSDWQKRQGVKQYTAINTVTGNRVSADTMDELVKLAKETPARYTPAELKAQIAKIYTPPKKFKSKGIKTKLNEGKTPVPVPVAPKPVAPKPVTPKPVVPKPVTPKPVVPKKPTTKKPTTTKPTTPPAKPTKPTPAPVVVPKPSGKTPTTKKPVTGANKAPVDVVMPIVVQKGQPTVIGGKTIAPKTDIYTVMKDADGFYNPYKNGQPLGNGYKDLDDAIADIARDAKSTRVNAKGNPTISYRMVGSKKPTKTTVIVPPTPVKPAPVKPAPVAPTPVKPTPTKPAPTKTPKPTPAPQPTPTKAPKAKKGKTPKVPATPRRTPTPVNKPRGRSATTSTNLLGRKKISKNIFTQRKNFTKETKNIVDKNIARGELHFYSKNQKDALANAYQKVANDLAGARKEFDNTHAVTDDAVALGYALVDHYQAKGDWDNAAKVAMDTSDMLTEAGRAVAAAKMAMRTTPQGRIKLIDKHMKRLQNMFNSRMNGRKIKLKGSTYAKIRAAKTQAEIDEANFEAYVEMWNQIPASFYEKLNSFRYTAMLANPKTHFRNLLGNILFAPMRASKNAIATGIEKYMVNEGTLKVRTQSILTPKDKALVDYAKENFEKSGMSKMGGSSKYSDARRPMMSRVFEHDTPEWIRAKVGELLELEDGFTFKPAYAKSLARYMKANGLTPAAITPEELRIADEFATDEALRATFRDVSVVSNWLVKHKQITANSSGFSKAAAIALEGIVPFTKTPVNILRRGIDYSPIGLAVSASKIMSAAKSGDQLALVKAIDGIAAGLTGTGVLALGAMLSSMGILEGRLPFDAEGNFRKTTGEQGYSLVIGDKSFSVDWIVPFALPLLTGVEMQKKWEAGGFGLTDMFDSLMDIAVPVTELSMMSGFTDILTTIQSQEDPSGKIASSLLSATTSYAGQFIPTISGQLARTIDPTRRSTASTADSAIGRTLEKFKNKQIAKIPIASMLLEPYTDQWGREQGTPLLTEDGKFRKPLMEDLERVAENIVLPFFISTKEASAVNDEITNVFKNLGDDRKMDVLPKSTTGYTISFSGGEYRMSKEDLTNMNKIRGEESLKALNAVIKTPEYNKLSVTEKAKVIEKIYSAAMEKAKTETLIKAGKDPWQVYTDSLGDNQQDYLEVKKAGVDPQTYSDMFDGRLNVDGKGAVSQIDAYNYLESTNLTNAQKAVLWSKVNGAWKKNPYRGDTLSASSGGSSSSSGGKRYSSTSKTAMGLAQKQVAGYKNLKIDSPEVSIAQAKALFKMLSTKG